MKLIHNTLVLCCFAMALPAQTDSHREKIRKKVNAMRKAMREGKIQEYNVYVKVRLHNGNLVRGIIKDGKFVELAEGIDFVSAAQPDQARAGMRIWYTIGMNSYIFVRYADIKKYTIGSKLSHQQVKLIELKLEKQLAETKENYRRVNEAARRLREGHTSPKGGTGNKPKDPMTLLSTAQAKILKDFPPSEGWGQEMIERLKKRRITLGVYPNPKEERFEKAYEQWASAFEALEKIREEQEKAKDEAAEKLEKAERRPRNGGTEKSDPEKSGEFGE